MSPRLSFPNFQDGGHGHFKLSGNIRSDLAILRRLKLADQPDIIVRQLRRVRLLTDRHDPANLALILLGPIAPIPRPNVRVLALVAPAMVHHRSLPVTHKSELFYRLLGAALRASLHLIFPR